jgi:hypothetical protein
MRRLTVLACLTVLLVSIRAPQLDAQTSSSSSSSSVAPATPPNALPAAQAELPKATGTHSFARRLATGLGGAVLGAFVGYFFSEVALGDWDQQAGHGNIRRAVWAGAGGAAGLTLGFSFPIGGRGGSPGEAVPQGMFPTGRSVILANEIAGSGASTAYDAIRALRPEWLQRRQSHYGQTQAEATIPVYLGNQLLGTLDELSTISAQNVKEIRRYDAAQATLLWGPGNAEGAIQVITK